MAAPGMSRARRGRRLGREPRAVGGERVITKKPLPVWQETLLLVGTAVVLALIIKTFFVQAFYIPSGSMRDTLKVDDRILVQKVSYWFGDVAPRRHRGVRRPGQLAGRGGGPGAEQRRSPRRCRRSGSTRPVGTW